MFETINQSAGIVSDVAKRGQNINDIFQPKLQLQMLDAQMDAEIDSMVQGFEQK